MPEYSKEQLVELYNNLPEKLQDALYSDQNAKNIEEICDKNNITTDEAIYDVARYTGYVLMGLLPPSELAAIFKKETKLNPVVAEEVANQLSRFVFFPVRQYLEPLYNAAISFKIADAQPSKKITAIKQIKEKITEPKIKSKSSARYREPIE